MNAIAQLEFERTCFDIAVQHLNHNAMGLPSDKMRALLLSCYLLYYFIVL